MSLIITNSYELTEDPSDMTFDELTDEIEDIWSRITDCQNNLKEIQKEERELRDTVKLLEEVRDSLDVEF